MMPHERCSQSGCWLQSFLPLEDLPLPKFQLGQPVRCVFVNEDAQTFISEGVIIGCCIANSIGLPGLWYWVRWHYVDAQSWVAVPHIEEAHEDELEPLELKGATV